MLGGIRNSSCVCCYPLDQDPEGVSLALPGLEQHPYCTWLSSQPVLLPSKSVPGQLRNIVVDPLWERLTAFFPVVLEALILMVLFLPEKIPLWCFTEVT